MTGIGAKPCSLKASALQTQTLGARAFICTASAFPMTPSQEAPRFFEKSSHPGQKDNIISHVNPNQFQKSKRPSVQHKLNIKKEIKKVHIVAPNIKRHTKILLPGWDKIPPKLWDISRLFPAKALG